MSQIGGPIQSSLSGALPSQEAAGKTRAKRDREKADSTRRFEDAVDLTVGGVETAEAVRKLDENDEGHERQQKRKAQRQAASEQAAQRAAASRPDPAGEHIDLRG